MSYTNTEQVRHHLALPTAVSEPITDQPVVLINDDFKVFHAGAVEAASVVVKSVHSVQLSRASFNLDSSSVSFSSSPVVPGSVVVASDSSLGTVFIENVDYVVDYASGVLTLKAGGQLSTGIWTTIWYIPFAIYLAGSDYLLREDRGEIRRLAGGAIASGETVLVDFKPVYFSLTEEIINHAVVLANRMVSNEVDAEGEFEADPTLGAAATFKALETVCRAAAGHELASSRGGDRTATAWMKLADDYAARSESLLKAFRPPFDSPRSPATS